MARYIDADALKSQITRYHMSLTPRYISKLVDAEIGDVIDIVDEQPTIEARPVVRGEWVLNKDGSGTCNQCGRTQKSVWDHDGWQNFCGHCGAEMQQGYERR